MMLALHHFAVNMLKYEFHYNYANIYSRFSLISSLCFLSDLLLLQDYGRVPLGYEDLFRQKQEHWTHIHHHHNPNRPSQSSPIFTTDFGAEVGIRCL